MPQRYKNRYKPPSPEQRNLLNELTHRQQPDFRAEPEARAITTAEERELREHLKGFSERTKGKSYEEKAAAILTFFDEEAEIRARHAGATDDPEVVDDPPAPEFYEETEPPTQGVLWDSDDLSPPTQTEPATNDIEEIDERLSDGDAIYDTADWLPGIVWDRYSPHLTLDQQHEELNYGPPGYKPEKE